eukprot:gene4561-9068_t
MTYVRLSDNEKGVNFDALESKSSTQCNNWAVVWCLMTICLTSFLARDLLLSPKLSLAEESDNSFSNVVHQGLNGSVVLLGDSLMNNPSTQFNLFGKMSSMLNYSFGYTNCGKGGNKIGEIITRLPDLISGMEAVTKEHKDTIRTAKDNKNSTVMLILFWDSDCCDSNEFFFPSTQFRERYERDVRYVIQSVLQTGAYMAIGGPLLGAWFKEEILDDCREINKEIARSFDMEYIDVRGAFLSEQRAGRNPLLPDREHPNDHGSWIIAKLFVNTMLNWKRN